MIGERACNGPVIEVSASECEGGVRMPEDLLLELETAAPVAERLEDVEDLLRVIRHQVGWAVEGMKGSALRFEEVWRRITMEVARGQTSEIQAIRPRLLGAFEKRLRLLRETHALAAGLSTLGRTDVPSPEILAPEIAGMERLKAGVFDRWQTAEDLEELAARDYPLSTADLERIAAAHAPPAAWYEGEEEHLF
jgi:hypothetical protein